MNQINKKQKRKYLKILHLDDDSIEVETIKKLIKSEDLPYILTTVSSHAQAREKFYKAEFDIVLLDAQVPDTSVVDLLNEFIKVPCIIVTGHEGEEFAIQALKNGASDYLVKDDSGMYLRLLPTVIEETLIKNRRAVMAMQDNVARAVSIIKHAVDSIVTINESGEIKSVNPATLRTFQYFEKELIGFNLNTLIPQSSPNHPNNHLLNKSGKILSNLVGKKHEFWGRRKDGKIIPLSSTVSDIILKNERFVTFFMRDISEQKHIEKELQEATMEATASSKAKSAFLANTSHEIRTPLNAITGFAHILLKLLKQNKIGKDFKRYLEIIISSGENLTEVINNVLSLCEIYSEKTNISKEPFDLKVVIKNLVSIYKKQALINGIDLEYRFDKELEGLIISDRLKLNQVLINLIDNSLKFTENGFIHLNVEKHEKNILFSVKDSGIGIPADKIAKILNPFEQADNSMTKNYGGAGLGLAITKEISESLGGKIWLESEEGNGSTFYFEAPLEKVETTSSSDQKDSTILYSDKNKILIVDDDENNLLLTKIILEDFGLSPIIARNGIEAIEVSINNSPDLILMDLQMPEMDGLEATRQIRNIENIKNIPIVGLSAHAMKEHEEDAFNAGLDDYLIKPLDFCKLKKVCLKYLNQK